MWNKDISGILARQELTESAVAAAAFAALQGCLPKPWRLEVDEGSFEKQSIDARWILRAPDRSRALLDIEAKRRLDPKDVKPITEAMRRRNPKGNYFVTAPFLSPRTRTLLRETASGYADLTGNLFLNLTAPAILIDTMGANADPWRERRPVMSLKGPAAGRVVRALCDFRPPYGIVELARRSQTPPSSVSRIVALLEREALLTRATRESVNSVDWKLLLQRWTHDYSFMRSNTVTRWLAPRGLDMLRQKLRAADWNYAVTGSLAAHTVAPYASARLAAVYTLNTTQAAEELGLKRMDTGANVLLAEPFNPVAFDRTTIHEGVTYAALPQVAADLLTSPGRGPTEGDELMQWMEAHEDGWRH